MVLCSAFLEAADGLLGLSQSKQPNRFLESATDLKPVLQAKNNAYRQWLASESKADLVKFQQARGKASQAICNAKNTWFQQKVQMIEKEKFRGVKWYGSA